MFNWLNVIQVFIIAIVVFIGLIFLGMKLLGVGNRGGSDNTTATENNDVETFKSENDSFLYKNGQEYPLALFMSVSDYHLGSEADESVEIKGSKEDGFECEEKPHLHFELLKNKEKIDPLIEKTSY